MRFGRIKQRVCAALLAAGFVCLAEPLRADIFVLSKGGEIRGELANPDESPRTRYVIKTFRGGTVTVGASLVRQVVPQRPAEVAYEKIKKKYPDTVDGHWRLAEWCKEKRLHDERDAHLARITELDHDHAEARRLLGYKLVNGKWLTRDEQMKGKGYVKHKGRWKLPQEVALIEKQARIDAKRQAWFKKLKQWRGWLDSDKAGRAKNSIAAISDPAATEALIRYLEREKNYRVKELYAAALARLGTGRAVAALVDYTLEDKSHDFRYTCLDLLEKDKPPLAVSKYVKKLKSKDNHEVNWAAIGLGRMKDLSSVRPLIDSLVTQHTVKVGKGNPGQLTTGFGRDSSGRSGTNFGAGNQAKVYKVRYRNPAVLEALRKLTGEDFDYDLGAWQSWYRSKKRKATRTNPRRD